MRRRSTAGSYILAALGLSALPACSEECARDACEAVQEPQPTSAIDQGIAGVVAYSTDACTNGCCECSYASVRLLVHRVDAAIASAAELEGRPPETMIVAEQQYSLELVPGRYAVCTDGYEPTCANLEIAAMEVVTVNVRTLFGPTQLNVFNAQGMAQPESVVH